MIIFLILNTVVLWEHHNNFDELWGRLTQNIRLTNDRRT